MVPGEAFGAPGHFRMSYALSDDDLEEGVRRLASLFAEARARGAGAGTGRSVAGRRRRGWRGRRRRCSTERRESEGTRGESPVARVLVTEKIAQRGLDLLAEAGHQVDVQQGLSPEELLGAVPGAAALIIRSATKVTSEVLAAGTDLRWWAGPASAWTTWTWRRPPGAA